jgi:RNA polymerase sigma factor (sigma-70 family)
MRVILSRTRQVDQQAIDATQSGLTTTPSLQGSATEAPQVSGKVSAEVSATVSSDGSSKAGSKDSSAKDSPLGRARRRNSVSLRPRPTNLKTTKTTKARKSAEEGLIRLSSTQERVLKLLLSEPMDYIDHPEFHEPNAADRIYCPAEIARPDVTWYRPLMDDFLSVRNRTVRSPKSQSSILLTGAQERILFMKYNFARFQVSEIQQQVASRAPTLTEALAALKWYAISKQYREQLAETNLGLVLAMSRRVRLSEIDFADLISEGNLALMRSVDKFDCGRGFKFSTYACRAILKAFSRHGIKITAYRKRFGTEFDPIYEKSNHLEVVRATHERECADEVKHIVLANKADLSEIERQVLGLRFGLDIHGPLSSATTAMTPAATPRERFTLEQVGQMIGVTKERVRQLQNKALEKIRLAVETANPAAAKEFAADMARREGRSESAFN